MPLDEHYSNKITKINLSHVSQGGPAKVATNKPQKRPPRHSHAAILSLQQQDIQPAKHELLRRIHHPQEQAAHNGQLPLLTQRQLVRQLDHQSQQGKTDEVLLQATKKTHGGVLSGRRKRWDGLPNYPVEQDDNEGRGRKRKEAAREIWLQ